MNCVVVLKYAKLSILFIRVDSKGKGYGYVVKMMHYTCTHNVH